MMTKILAWLFILAMGVCGATSPMPTLMPTSVPVSSCYVGIVGPGMTTAPVKSAAPADANVCAMFCFVCSATDKSGCTVGSRYTNYVPLSSSTATQMASMPTVYTALSTCTTNDCNMPTAGGVCGATSPMPTLMPTLAPASVVVASCYMGLNGAAVVQAVPAGANVCVAYCFVCSATDNSGCKVGTQNTNYAAVSAATAAQMAMMPTVYIGLKTCATTNCNMPAAAGLCQQPPSSPAPSFAPTPAVFVEVEYYDGAVCAGEPTLEMSLQVGVCQRVAKYDSVGALTQSAYEIASVTLSSAGVYSMTEQLYTDAACTIKSGEPFVYPAPPSSYALGKCTSIPPTDNRDAPSSLIVRSVSASTLPTLSFNAVVTNTYTSPESCHSAGMPSEQIMYNLDTCQGSMPTDGSAPTVWVKFACAGVDMVQTQYFSDAACAVVYAGYPPPLPMSVYETFGNGAAAACDLQPNTNSTTLQPDRYSILTCASAPTALPTRSPTYLRGQPTPKPTRRPTPMPSLHPVGLDCWLSHDIFSGEPPVEQRLPPMYNASAYECVSYCEVCALSSAEPTFEPTQPPSAQPTMTQCKAGQRAPAFSLLPKSITPLFKISHPELLSCVEDGCNYSPETASKICLSPVPTPLPSKAPSSKSVVPTALPSKAPSSKSVVPTALPSKAPSSKSVVPTALPSKAPSSKSVVPTALPSKAPASKSAAPTPLVYSFKPTVAPSAMPSSMPAPVLTVTVVQVIAGSGAAAWSPAMTADFIAAVAAAAGVSASSVTIVTITIQGARITMPRLGSGLGLGLVQSARILAATGGATVTYKIAAPTLETAQSIQKTLTAAVTTGAFTKSLQAKAAGTPLASATASIAGLSTTVTTPAPVSSPTGSPNSASSNASAGKGMSSTNLAVIGAGVGVALALLGAFLAYRYFSAAKTAAAAATGTNYEMRQTEGSVSHVQGPANGNKRGSNFSAESQYNDSDFDSQNGLSAHALGKTLVTPSPLHQGDISQTVHPERHHSSSINYAPAARLSASGGANSVKP